MEQDKIKLIKSTHETMQELSDRITSAGIESAFTEGRYHHEIAWDIDMTSTGAASYFQKLVGIVDNPTGEAEKVVSSLPMDKVQEVYDNAKGALDTGIEASVKFYANALTNKAGQKMTEEDKQRMQPVMKAIRALIVYHEIKDATPLQEYRR